MGVLLERAGRLVEAAGALYDATSVGVAIHAAPRLESSRTVQAVGPAAVLILEAAGRIADLAHNEEGHRVIAQHQALQRALIRRDLVRLYTAIGSPYGSFIDDAVREACRMSAKRLVESLLGFALTLARGPGPGDIPGEVIEAQVEITSRLEGARDLGSLLSEALVALREAFETESEAGVEAPCTNGRYQLAEAAQVA
jgi:hypothetical protein